MEDYNPGCAPEPESWLELDEQEQRNLRHSADILKQTISKVNLD